MGQGNLPHSIQEPNTMLRNSAASVEAICDTAENNIIVKPECQVTKFFSTGSTLLNLALTDTLMVADPFPTLREGVHHAVFSV